MLFIGNKKGAIVGVLNNDIPNGFPYYNDHHREKLAYGEVTLEFDVPTQNDMTDLLETEGFIIYTNLDGEFELFRIKEIEDVHNSTFLTHVYCEISAMSDLLGYIVRPITFTSQSLEQVATSILDGTGWEIGHVYYDEVFDLKIEDYITSLEALHLVLSKFDAEVEFRVELEGTNIQRKVVNFYSQRGTETDNIFEYGRNLTEVTRKENSNELVTAMIGVGKDDANGNTLTFNGASVTVPNGFEKVGDYIADLNALQSYTPNGEHIFGVHKDDNATTAQELFDNTLKELKKKSKPIMTYSTKTLMLEQLVGYEHEKCRIGDTIIVKDTTFDPPLYLQARVIEKDTCITDKAAGDIVIGEYQEIKVVYPAKLKTMQVKMASQEVKIVAVSEVADAAQADVTTLDTNLISVINNKPAEQTIMLNRSSGGQLIVGDAGNTKGVVSILDSDGENKGDFSSGEGSLSTLRVGTLEANNVTNSQEAISIYVNASTGVDDDSRDGSSGFPFKTIQYAINRLGKFLVGDVYIYTTGTFYEKVLIEGFSGGGDLCFKLQTSTIKGQLYFSRCTCSFQVEGTSDSSWTYVEATGSDIPIAVHRCMFGVFKYVMSNGKQLSNYSAFVYGTAGCIFDTCRLTNATHSGIAVQVSRAYLYNCKGKSTQYGVYALNASDVGLIGTVPNGITSWINVDPSSTATYGTVTPTDDTYDGSPGTTYTTTTYNSTQSGSYRDNYASWRTDNNYVYQGQYSGYGPYTGAIWLDNTTLRSNLSGKTVQAAKLYLKRRSSGGSSAATGAYLVGITNTGESGAPNRVTSYGYIGSWKWGEGKFVTIPSQAISDIKDTVINGLALYNNSNGYMIFEGYDNATYKPKIQVTYY